MGRELTRQGAGRQGLAGWHAGRLAGSQQPPPVARGIQLAPACAWAAAPVGPAHLQHRHAMKAGTQSVIKPGRQGRAVLEPCKASQLLSSDSRMAELVEQSSHTHSTSATHLQPQTSFPALPDWKRRAGSSQSAHCRCEPPLWWQPLCPRPPRPPRAC